MVNSSAPTTTYTINGTPFFAPELDSGLYIVATPIGNLSDITLRALQILAGVNACWCEDTRRTRKLLSHYAITARTRSYRPHNAHRQIPHIVAALQEGHAIALTSDAGTPLISDPGARLVQAVIAAGHKVVPVPGASAVLAGLVGSGLCAGGFSFAGFLPAKGKSRRLAIETWTRCQGPVVLFEAPQRLAKTLTDLANACGEDRKVVIARELTKTFETWERGTLGMCAAAHRKQETPRGEHVIVLEGGAPDPGAPGLDETELDVTITTLLAKRQSLRQIAETLSVATKLSRRDLYQRALKVKRRQEEDL